MKRLRIAAVISVLSTTVMVSPSCHGLAGHTPGPLDQNAHQRAATIAAALIYATISDQRNPPREDGLPVIPVRGDSETTAFSLEELARLPVPPTVTVAGRSIAEYRQESFYSPNGSRRRVIGFYDPKVFRPLPGTNVTERPFGGYPAFFEVIILEDAGKAYIDIP